MPAYNLRLSFGVDDEAGKESLGLVMLEAETDKEAIAKAMDMVHETYGRPLQAANLRSLDGRTIWSLRSPDFVED